MPTPFPLPRPLRAATLAATLVFASAGAARAQVGRGDVVRLFYVEGGETQGEFIRADSQFVLLHLVGAIDTTRVPLAAVTRAELRRGSTMGGWDEFGHTVLVGLIATGAVAWAMVKGEKGTEKGITTAFVAIGASIATLGVLVTAAIRSTTTTETWDPVDLGILISR